MLTARSDCLTSDCRTWWREAVEPKPVLDYPLGDNPSKLGAYEEIESADADGVTEDSHSQPDGRDRYIHLGGESPAVLIPGSLHDQSGQGHVTTDSPCSSSASIQANISDKLGSIPSLPDDQIARSEDFGDSLASEETLLEERKNASLIVGLDVPLTMLIELSVASLTLHTESLSTKAMGLSDQLVELLRERDELLMLREASDDFIILLDMLHQRRARASKAALLQTARSRIRTKGIHRVNLTWFSTSLFGTPARSMNSLRERFTTESWKQPKPAGSTYSTTSTQNGACEAISLNATGGSAAYYKELHLQSKLRRPKALPMQKVWNKKKGEDAMSDQPEPQHQQNGTHHVGQPQTELDSEPISQLSIDRAQERFEKLKTTCALLAWPNGQPRLSQSLSICLPFCVDPVRGVTLRDLRIINQILYGALLENDSTKQLMNSYINSTCQKFHVASWIATSNEHVRVGGGGGCSDMKLNGNGVH